MRIELTTKHGPSGKPALLTLSDFGATINLTIAAAGERAELSLSIDDARTVMSALQLIGGVLEREYRGANR